MKKSYFSNLGLFLLAMLCTAQMFAQQVVNMPATNVNAGTFTPAGGGVCFIRFSDQGGEGAAYGQPMGLGTQITFAPSNPANKIRVSFITPTQWNPPAPAGNNTQFNGLAEPTFDALYVYDGPNVAAPVISGGQSATAGPGLGFTGWNNNSGYPNNYAAPVVAGLPTFDRSVRATAGNASGALTFRFVADFSVQEPGWTAMVWEEFAGNGPNTVAPFVVPAAGACAMTAPGNVTAPAGAGTCAANVTVASPIFTPAGCNSTANLFYSVDGGTPILIGNVVPATVTLLNIPVGVHTITWSLVNLCGGASAAPVTSTVTVLDTQPPVITCPGNAIINLAPGDCSAFFSWNIGITDNCPLVVPGLVTQNPNGPGSCTYNPAQAISPTLSLSCFANNTQHYRVFGGPTQPATSITGVQIGQRVGNGGNYTVRVYTLNTGTVPVLANMTLLGMQVFNMGNTPPYPKYVQTTFTTPIPIAAGTRYVIRIDPGTTFTMGNIVNADCPATPSYIGGCVPIGTFASLGFGTLSLAFNVNTLVAAPPPNQTSGLPSGSEFPIGVTTNCYQGVDVAGNTATCCFTVTVNEYPDAITSLICNDHVQFSLDEDCVDNIKADQILEGGPYGCYDNYIVELDKTTNGVYCNGPFVPAVLNANDVGKCYCVRVTDPATGNSCWGEVCVEDKLDPTISCAPQDLECNELPINEPSPALTGPQEFIKVVDDEIDTNAAAPDQITYTFNVPIPTGIPVLDLDVRLDMDFGWWGELNMNLTSPDGFASSPLELGGCNGQSFTFDAQFDDEGIAGFTLCVQFDVDGAHIQSLQLPGVQSPNIFSPFDGHAAGGTWTWLIMDTFSDNDPVTGGYIRMVGLIITVNAPAILPADNCDANPTTTFMDSFVDNGCDGVVQTRMWTVTDDSGNTATCNQVITYNTTTLADIVFPPNYDDLQAPSFDCGLFQGANGGFVGYPTPEWIENQGLQGRPYMNGIDAQGYCDINWTYEDVVIDVCDGSYKIRRQWIIIDWCTGEDIEVNQIIKVLDTTGPSIAVDVDPGTPGIDAPNLVNNIPTVILGTDYYACCSKENAPSLIVGDDCSDVVNAKVDIRLGAAVTSAKVGTVNGSLTLLSTWPLTWQVTFNQGLLCIPIGTYFYHYSVTDDCGNVGTFVQRVIVRDYTPPTAICHEYTTVAVGADDSWDCYPANGVKTLAEQGGIVWVPATAFDNGSSDNCANILLTVRRMAPYTDCINNLNPQDSDPFCDPTDLSFDFVSEYQIAIQENDSIKFYCCEVGTSQMVILRVYQLDDNGNFVFGPDNQPIYNECMVEIEVQDKIKPFCQAPANKTVTCEEFDPLIWYGNLTYGDNCCVEDVDTSYTYIPNQITFEQCNYGQVRRIFTVEDCNGNSSRCTQTITVNYKELYRVYFPDDQNITQCNGTNMLVQPVIFGENCELIGVSHEDQIFDVVPDACYKILRTWKILNWCTYNPNQGEVVIPNPTTSTQGARIWIGGNATTPPAVGTIPAWANYNAQSPEVATVPALMINYPTSLVNPGTPAYVYTQVIKVQDQTPPTQAAIDPSLSTPNYDFCDYSTNDPLQWNEDASYNPWGIDNTWSPQCQSHDLCEGIVDLSILGQDDCTGDNVNFRYLLFLDLNGDGVMETTINSEIPTLGFGIKEDELSNGFRIGRVTRDFETDDLAPTFDHTKYPNFALPYGSHKIKWIVEDRCGNDFSKEYPIIVRDCKNPTIVCINGLAVNQMNTPVGVMPASVCLWATDFLQYTEDNCSQPWQIDVAIRDQDVNPGAGFPIDPATGLPQIQLCWDCSQLGTNSIELWAKDKAGNADFCLTYLILSDNTGVCGPVQGTANVAGALKTNAQFTAPVQNPGGVANAQVKMVGQGANGIPDPAVFGTNDLGTFNFAGLPVLSDWNVVPAKDNNPLNGVSTFDLVAMSKHILGVKPFTTGYQYLAADINNNKQVTTFDIVELRKLILGVYTDFPANTSWRFVDKSFNFSMATNPLQQNFKEFVQIGDIPVGQTNGVDFVGVKVGDLNSDVIANNIVSVEDRNPVATQLFDVKDRDVKAGEEVIVEFTAAELAKAAGFQFTMNYNGLDFVEILNGANLTTENFAVFAQDKAITASWNGDATEATFSVKFRATTDGKLSTMLGVSSRITAAEAYTKDAQQMDVAFRFNGENGSTIAGVGFELYQNMPNPFVDKTFIGFNMPAKADATLNVYDAQGKLLVSQSGNFNKGYNSIAVDRASLKGAGLVYYTIETATDSATRKMIMMD